MWSGSCPSGTQPLLSALWLPSAPCQAEGHCRVLCMQHFLVAAWVVLVSMSGLAAPLPSWDQGQADIPIYYCGTDLSLQLSKCLRPLQRVLCLLLKAALCWASWRGGCEHIWKHWWNQQEICRGLSFSLFALDLPSRKTAVPGSPKIQYLCTCAWGPKIQYSC